MSIDRRWFRVAGVGCSFADSWKELIHHLVLEGKPILFVSFNGNQQENPPILRHPQGYLACDCDEQAFLQATLVDALCWLVLNGLNAEERSKRGGWQWGGRLMGLGDGSRPPQSSGNSKLSSVPSP